MSPSALLLQLVLGALLGAAGQGIRVVVGLKKLQDQAVTQGNTSPSMVSLPRLGISLLIGGIAGLLASAWLPEGPWDTVRIAGLLSAGYAGTDAIESFFHRAISKTAGVDISTAPLATATEADNQPPPVG